MQESDSWKPLWKAFEARRPFRDIPILAGQSRGKEIHLKLSGAPYYGADGAFLGFRGSTTDETSEILARERAEDVQTRFADAMENLNAGFVLWDAEGRFVRCNGYFKTVFPGQAKNMVPGICFEDYIRKIADGSFNREIIGGPERWIASRLASHEESSSDREVMFQDGRWMKIQKKRLQDGSVLTFYYDITELKEREEELRQAIL